MEKFLRFFSVFLAAGMLFAILASPSNALLIGGPDMIAAPLSVADDAPGAENDAQQAFDEAQNVLLTRDLGVDGGGVLTTGTLVDSHMIFFNTPDSATVTDTATWTFDGLILGVMSDSAGLLEAASNDLLGAPGTDYPGSFSARGLEGGDAYLFSGDQITVTMRVAEPGDWIRVVTQAKPVPEPATLLLLGTGLAGLGLVGSKKRKSKR